MQVSVDSLKNKIRSMRSEYVNIKTAEDTTGNEIQPKKPECYKDMLLAFADMKGFGDIEFGRERTSVDETTACDDGTVKVHELRNCHVSVDDGYTVDEVDEEDGTGKQHKRELEIQQEIDRQRAVQKKPKVDIGASWKASGRRLQKVWCKQQRRPATSASLGKPPVAVALKSCWRLLKTPSTL